MKVDLTGVSSILKTLATGTYTEYKLPKVPEAGPVGISLRGIPEAINNLTVFKDLLSDKAVEVVANIVVDLLAHSQPRVPHDSGELKASGRAVVLFGSGGKGGYHKIVGEGTWNHESGVKANLSGLKGRTRNLNWISGNVVYSRENEDGEDIALWAHEELLPYEARPAKPAATKPGRGPKYLETPFNERRDTYMGWLSDAFSYGELSRDIRKGLQVSKIGREYEVDITKLRRDVV